MRGNAPVLVVAVLLLTAGVAAGQPQRLRWGGDAEGGAPFIEARADDPSRVEGFDVDIAALLAQGLGRVPNFVQTGFTTIEAAVRRGDVDVALGGVEDSPARRMRLAVTLPYYEFREVLTVRAADGARYRTLADLANRRVATLGATQAADLLADAGVRLGVVPVIYEDDVHPYTDLALGRVDAVVLDEVLAERGVRRNRALMNQAGGLAVGHYVAVLPPGQERLRDEMDEILRQAMRDGRLERIFRRWGLWNADQPRLYARVLGGAGVSAEAAEVRGGVSPATDLTSLARYLPSFLRAAGWTVVLSCASMTLAVVLGAGIAAGRVYGQSWLRFVLVTYVEVIRGTPLLLQLFVLYFGLAAIVQLPAVAAAILGLGLNYAAYESEIYRSALEAVPKGQLDAARALGFGAWQTLRLVRGPQAFRLALAPMTNDFVALLKDSSLVSAITVVELTKQTSILAANIGSWLVPGLLCATFYLALSLPLARLARRIERSWSRA